MKFQILKTAHRNLLTITCLSFLFFMGSGFVPAATPLAATCPTFSVLLSEKGSSSVTFDVEKSGEGTIVVQYVRNGTQYSDVYTVSGSSIEFENLPSGTYKFTFTTVCWNGGNSIIIDDIII